MTMQPLESRRSRPDVSVVVPLFNEEESVPILYRELTHALRALGVDYELIFVDDGSSDHTLFKLRRITLEDPRVVTIRFRRNFGQAAAIQAGFDQVRGRFVVTMDGDLQNDPGDIGPMLEWLDRGFDVVTGWRLRRQDRWLTRRVPSTAANWLISRLTGVRLHDNGCTLKAYRRPVVKRIVLKAEMHRFLAPLLSLSGCRFKELVVNHRSRLYGSTKYGLSRIWKVALDLLAVKMILRFISHPLAWFAVIAFPLGVAGLATGLASFALDRELVVPASISVVLLFSSAQMLLLGLLAELVVYFGDYDETEPMLVTMETRSGSR